jgi:hypothetical protein
MNIRKRDERLQYDWDYNSAMNDGCLIRNTLKIFAITCVLTAIIYTLTKAYSL